MPKEISRTMMASMENIGISLTGIGGGTGELPAFAGAGR